MSKNQSCNCGPAIAALERRVSQIEAEMAAIAQAINQMTSVLSRDINNVHGAVQTSNKELAAITIATGATAVTTKLLQGTVETEFDESQKLQRTQTSAIVQLDSVRTYTDAVSLANKTVAFTLEVDERFSKAVEGVVLNRILYDKHFGAIKDEYQSKVRTIGSHIYEIWEKDIAPSEEAAKVPAQVHQELAVEVDLQRLASRSSLLDSDLDLIRRQHLEPMVALDAGFEKSVQEQYAIAGKPAEGSAIVVPAAVAVYDHTVEAFVDCRVDPLGQIHGADRLPQHARYCQSDEGKNRIRRAVRVRPMTEEETVRLAAAMERLAGRGIIDDALLGGYRKYLESTSLGMIVSSTEAEVQSNG